MAEHATPEEVPVRSVMDDGILVVTIDHPPVNALSHAVRVALMEAAERLDHDPELQAMILCSTGSVFIGGADIREFSGPRRDPLLNAVCHRIEACTKPVLAAMQGAALGGGFEVALASHYRVASPAAVVAFPEVLLGLLPGAGGTQRAPRLCGAALALDLMLTGRRLTAGDALRAGLVDVLSDAPLDHARQWARELFARREPLPRAREGRALADRELAMAQLNQAIGLITPADVHTFARERIARCVSAAVDTPFEQGAQMEAEAFLECLASPEREQLVAQFFAARAARKSQNT